MLKPLKLYNFQSSPAEDWHQDIVMGLQRPTKVLPSKLFYDEYGSRLFDQICELPEYYPTRIEQAIMDHNIDEMASLLGHGSLLIEYGSGSSQKTRTLLDNLPNLAGYIPIDISQEHLMQSAADITAAYPDLEVAPVCADYETNFQIPTLSRPVSRRVIYYPGSTLGNFHPPEAVAFLNQMRTVCGPESNLLIGIDLKKDEGLLHRAYNDCAGVTAAFNLNILTHLNREIGANFDLDKFEHHAFYNRQAGRIEMHLRSLHEQIVWVNGHTISFKAGECIWTESSYKYSLNEFAGLADQAGLTVKSVWTDPNNLFSVQYLTPNPTNDSER